MEKQKTFAAIRKQVMASVSKRNSAPMIGAYRGYKCAMAIRAMQYLLAMQGQDSPHSVNYSWNAERVCGFDKAPDGSTRVRYHIICGEKEEIPHWDFVPSVEETTEPEFPFALAA